MSKNDKPTPKDVSIVQQMANSYKLIDEATQRIADNLNYGNTVAMAGKASSEAAKKTYQETGDIILEAANAQNLLNDGNVEAYNQAITNMGIEQELVEIAKKQVDLKRKMIEAGNDKDALAALQEEYDALDAKKDQVKAIQEEAKYNNLVADKKKEMMKPMADMKEKWANTRATMTAAWQTLKTGPGLMAMMTMGVLALGMAMFKAFMATEKAVQNIYDTTGLSVAQVGAMRDQANGLRSEFSQMGMGFEDILKTQQSFIGEFGNMVGMGDEMVESLGAMQYMFGLSAEESAKVMNTMMGITDGTRQGAEDMAVMVKNAAGENFADAGQVMKDIANLSGEALAYFSGNPEQLAKAAAFARGLGIEISKLTGAADNLLNLESSLTNEMEAEMLIGRNLNLDRMRAAAFQGDMVTMGKEILKQTGGLENFNSMNVVQQKAMAKAMGMSVGDLKSMLVSEEKLKNLTADERAELEAIGKEQEKQKEMSFEELKAQKERQVATEKFKRIWQDLIARLQEKFVPVFEQVATYLEENSGTVDDIVDGVVGIASFLGSIVTTMMRWWKTTLAVYLLWKGISLYAKMSGTSITEMAGKKLGLGKDKTPDISGSDDATKKATTPGKGMDAGKMLKGAAAMLLMAAALWVMAKALQEFASVSWESILKGAVGLLILAGVVFLLGQIVGPILVGAFAMLILAGALWVMGAALLMFNDINWESLGKAAVALLGLAAIASLLGFMVIPIMLGAWAMGILSAALLLFAVATIPLAATGPKTLEFLEGLMTLDGALLREAATGIVAIGAALAVFGMGSLVAGIGAFFGGDPVKHFKRFAEIGPDLKVASEAITHIAESVNLFGEIKTESEHLKIAAQNIGIYAGSLMAASGAQTAFAATAAIATPFMAITGMLSGIMGGEKDTDEIKVKEMSDLRKDIQELKDTFSSIVINMDGKRVGEVIKGSSPGTRMA